MKITPISLGKNNDFFQIGYLKSRQLAVSHFKGFPLKHYSRKPVIIFIVRQQQHLWRVTFTWLTTAKKLHIPLFLYVPRIK